MKRLLLLIIAIVFCNPSAYAKIKTVEYKSEGRPYMTVIGNFDKGILVDGKVSIAVVYIETIIIKGEYEKGKIIGSLRQGDFIVEVQGSISNNKNGGILTKCKPNDWRCNLQIKATMHFSDSYCSVPTTVTPYINTSSINITGKSTISFERSLGLALQGIKRNIDNQKKKINNREYYSATITYKGGLIYKGYIVQDLDGYRFTMPMMQKGTLGVLGAKLIWPNGDTFEGGVYNFNDSCSSGPVRPYCGTIKYHDGQVLQYDCRKFDDFKIGDNGLCVSPSEMKESFENTIREREEERLRKIREEREREIREEEERKAAELKAEQEAEREKREKKLARKNELIRKYGQKYGEAIFNREPKTGMTIKMVQEMHQKQGRMSRRISQGREITILSYGGNYVSFGGISGITSMYEYTFVDGRLVEFSSTDGQASIDW